ncbi:hypothetical protein [Nonomuraea aurantiaca]|uniref:hypothetical protein n=1 Tax=Nonomuraea aurantiaca TaxID=2878562 RepID=UPI001CD9CF94|nr:hypothetical protein [Nonomuraea aurantiaca]MCA2230267.1 hypothetical protein [Nonomuraea aurantiaca]
MEHIAAEQAELPFGIDGIVIKCDLAGDQRQAGFSSRAPRWAIAYKLPAVEKITKLVGVEWNTGRTGVIAPRAVLEPVTLDGSVVTYATLHNIADITRRGLMLGDSVVVYKAGDVIPRVQSPVVHLRTGDEQPIIFPEVCPSCGDAIDRSQERWRCVRGRACRAIASISYAVGRDQLDIRGPGRQPHPAAVGRGVAAAAGWTLGTPPAPYRLPDTHDERAGVVVAQGVEHLAGEVRLEHFRQQDGNDLKLRGEPLLGEGEGAVQLGKGVQVEPRRLERDDNSARAPPPRAVRARARSR